MQTMNCQNFKEVLDSYLSDELAVETNHAIIRHAEQCVNCRREMSARKNLRARLRGVVTSTQASPDFHNRLRTRLREEALSSNETTPLPASPRVSIFKQWFGQFARPQFALAATALLLITVGVFYFGAPRNTVLAAELSPMLWQQTAGDHDHCAVNWLRAQQTIAEPVHGVDEFDPALKYLTKYSQHAALGLTFHSAHVCAQDGRQFVHLVYTRGDDLVSLLVTKRNAEAMKNGVVPTDDGVKAGFQKLLGVMNKYNVQALQTSKYIILLVSTLADTQNTEIAEKLAKPISQHIRTIEGK